MSRIGMTKWLVLGAAAALTACASNPGSGSSATAYGDVGPESQLNGVWLDSAGGLWLDSVGVIHHGRRGRAGGLYAEDFGTMTNANIIGHMALQDSLVVALSELGVARATNPEVRAFAQRMIDAHTGYRVADLRIASQGGIVVLMAPTDTLDYFLARRMDSRLSNLSGADWDRGFMSEEVLLQRHIMSDLKALRDHASGPVQQLADQAIPNAHANQDAAQKLWRKIGGKGSQYGTSAFPGGNGGH